MSVPSAPRLIVNLKTYPEATGKRAIALARATARLDGKSSIGVALAPQAVDVRACAAAGARVYAQGFDKIASSQSTGATRWESLLDAGAEGAILNHSERRLALADLSWYIDVVRKSRRLSVLCAEDAAEATSFAGLRPHVLAIEPPQLIGGDVSVTSADPGIVRDTVSAVHRVAPRLPVLCGAGVKDGRDASAARELGAYGILVASGVAKAKDPGAALRDLAHGLAGKP